MMSFLQDIRGCVVFFVKPNLYTNLQGPFVVRNSMVHELVDGILHNVVTADVDVQKLDLTGIH